MTFQAKSVEHDSACMAVCADSPVAITDTKQSQLIQRQKLCRTHESAALYNIDA